MYLFSRALFLFFQLFQLFFKPFVEERVFLNKRKREASNVMDKNWIKNLFQAIFHIRPPFYGRKSNIFLEKVQIIYTHKKKMIKTV